MNVTGGDIFDQIAALAGETQRLLKENKRLRDALNLVRNIGLRDGNHDASEILLIVDRVLVEERGK